MRLLLTKGDRRSARVLPRKRIGRYWISAESDSGGSDDLLCVEGVQNQWVLRSNKHVEVLDAEEKPLRAQNVSEGQLYQIRIIETNEHATIYAEPETADRKQFTRNKFPSSGKITLGSSSASDICFTSPFITENHATIFIEGENIRVVDQKAAIGGDNGKENTTGTFVNNKRVFEQALKPGDTIAIMDLMIIIGKGFFAVNNPGGQVTLSNTLKPLELKLPQKKSEDEEIEESSSGFLFFRSPRFRREIISPQIKIDAPPAEEKKDETPMIMVLGPAVTMGLASGVMAFSAVGNVMNHTTTMGQAAPMLVMSGAMMLGMIVWPIVSHSQEARRKTKKEYERRVKYGKYLVAAQDNIDKEKKQQQEILHENYVEVQECVERIRNRERNLWERTQGHNDFLDIRLGIGDWPFSANFEVPDRSFVLEEDIMQEELFGIIDAPRVLKDVPVVVSLTERFSMGVIGERSEEVSFMKSLIFQLAALHSYDEVKFLFIYDKSEEDQWSFARWLPHVWSNDKDMRYIARTIEEVRRLSAFLEQEALQKEKSEDGTNLRYVVFALDRHLAGKCEALNSVFKAKEYKGVSVLAVYDELRHLPKDCRVVLEVQGEQSRLYDRLNTAGDHIGFTPDRNLTLDAGKLAVQLANIKLESAESAFELPQMITFLEMFQVGKIEHLNALTRWKESSPVRTLGAPVGVGVTGEPFVLDLHEKAHGPHGLVAGMTGSGKSEFIMTMILSLAINYHPNEVAFVLIDYKGGGMANAFSDLPHTVGVITNLEGAAVNRSLASIQSELRRRQAIFNEATKKTQVSNIDIYKYQSLYREGRVTEPLPHLLIISDEFAELKTQQPEFMEQLVSAARIGRSLGVHLILATQKPSGVVDDQIWANSKFKICLKVQDRADSMEMIKKPDAAELVEVGRFYLQVGYDELFELGQSAWAGAPYHPTDRVERDYDASVVMLDTQGIPLLQVRPASASRGSGDAAKQLDEVTNYLVAIAKDEGITNQLLWLPPLEQRIYFDALYKKYEAPKQTPYMMDSALGEYDDPSNQAQGLMRLSLSEGGNLLLFGMTGSGKTHFISSLVYSLMQAHTPDEVHFYLLDFGSETLTSFAPAPHTGDVLLSMDAEKIKNLFSMLNAELTRRRKLLVEYGGDYSSYVSQVTNPLPNIIVAINNFAGFSEMYEDGEEWINVLTREGVKYGIYFILTAQSPNSVRYKLQQNFKQQICFQLSDESDYSAVFGRLEGLSPAQNPGRGLYRNEGRVFEFQAVLTSEELADSPRKMREMCLELAGQWTGTAAQPVPCLPEAVTSDFLQPTSSDIENRTLPVAVEKETLDTVRYDFSRYVATFVMSRGSEHLEFLAALTELIAQFDSGSVLVVDSSGVLRDVNAKHPVSIEDAKTLLTQGSKAKAQKNSYAFVVIPEFANVYEALDAKEQETFIALLIQMHAQGSSIILGSSAGDFASIAYEAWLPDFASMADGIWLGPGFEEQYHLKAQNTSYNLKIDKGFGFIVKDEMVCLCKFLIAGKDA
ncbi:MAG: type VII secretion protein EssC [Coriobacteriia bacterium]|nr:type VII secretion protein EssC [Coriobacteriia bacterium]